MRDAASKNPNGECHISVNIKTTYFLFSDNESTFVSKVFSHEMFGRVDNYRLGGVFTYKINFHIRVENRPIRGRENDKDMRTSMWENYFTKLLDFYAWY